LQFSRTFFAVSDTFREGIGSIVTLTVNALLLVVALAAIAAPPQSHLADRRAMDESIANLVKEFHGVIGVAAINLETREELAINADTRFPTASTIKTAVMLEAYHQIADGSLALDTVLTLRDAEKVGGSGVLRQMHDGLGLRVSDLLYLMIALSDNTATNMLVNRLGTARIDDRLAAYGFKDTRIFRPTFRDGRADVLPELEKEFGLGMTTPREMARLMALIADQKAVSPAASDAMFATLAKQQDRAMIPRLLPSDDSLRIGNKTGTDEEKQPGSNGVRGQVRSDAAIVAGPGLRYVIAIYTRQVQDTRWTIDNDALVTGARISKLLYDYFRKGRAPTR
jgi:beta-lactamase class A